MQYFALHSIYDVHGTICILIAIYQDILLTECYLNY